jgi:hypothetical protein
MTIYGPSRTSLSTYPSGPCSKVPGPNQTCTQDAPCPPCTECNKDGAGHYVPSVPPGCQQAPCPFCLQCPPECAGANPGLNRDNAPKRFPNEAPSQVIDKPPGPFTPSVDPNRDCGATGCDPCSGAPLPWPPKPPAQRPTCCAEGCGGKPAGTCVPCP